MHSGYLERWSYSKFIFKTKKAKKKRTLRKSEVFLILVVYSEVQVMTRVCGLYERKVTDIGYKGWDANGSGHRDHRDAGP